MRNIKPATVSRLLGLSSELFFRLRSRIDRVRRNVGGEHISVQHRQLEKGSVDKAASFIFATTHMELPTWGK